MAEGIVPYIQEPSGVTIAYPCYEGQNPIYIRLDRQCIAASTVDMGHAGVIFTLRDVLGVCSTCGPNCESWALRLELNPLETLFKLEMPQ